MRIKTKILIPVLVLIIIVAAAILISNVVLFSNYVDGTVEANVGVSARIADNSIEELKEEARIASRYISENKIITDSIINGDRDTLLAQALKLQTETGVEFCTITDPEGTVTLRSHEPDNFGDSIASQANIQAAMAGESLSLLEKGTAILLSVRSGSPVYDGRGELIAVVSVGYRLDTEHFVDSVKELAACETTVFLGDERIATTVLQQDGTRAVGTKADAGISAAVLAGTEYTGQASILGRDAITNYSPINGPDGQVIGMLFVGHYADEAATAITAFVQSGLAITLVLLVVAFAIILFVIRRIVTPIHTLVGNASDLAAGNFNFNAVNIEASATNDEVALLERSFGGVVSVVNELVQELHRMGREIDEEGDVDARVDASRFTGAYHVVVESVNKTLDGLTDNVSMVMGCLNQFGSGDFKVNMPKLPGKKADLNTAIDNMSNNLMSINKDMGALVQDAIAGSLSSRVELSNYKGDWAALMSEMNRLMEVVAEPIAEASEVMRLVAGGNFDRKMTGRYKGDFLVIKEAINTTVTNIASYIDEISRSLTGLANNDLNQVITREYVGGFSEIKRALNSIVENLNSVIGEINSASDQVNVGARQISESSMSLASGATEQASSVEKLNATVIKINENTRRNAADAKEAETLSDNSKANAAKGNDDMRSMLESMEGIKASSDKMAQVVKVIDEIAFQTNLLALNAAVEAARAGENGRGFAVVAEEVRTLASRSQASAKETSELIEESIQKVSKGSQMAEQTADTLNAIIGDVSKVADIITNIAAASNAQTEAIGEVSEGLSQITGVVQNNSAMSEEAAAASQELSSQSEVMRNLVSVFKLNS